MGLDEDTKERPVGEAERVKNGTEPRERLSGEPLLDYLEKTVEITWQGKKKAVKIGMLKNDVVLNDGENEFIYRVRLVTTEGKRENNEDFAMARLDEAGRLILMNNDGMGGPENGEVVSEEAAEAVLENADKGVGLDAMIERARERVTTEGTTADLVMIEGKEVEGRHIGDGRVVLLNVGGAQMEEKTRDHSLVRRLLDMGEVIDPNIHNGRHIISRALGMKDSRADSFEATMGIGDSLIMFTDGVVDAAGYYVGAEEFRQIGEEPEDLFNFVAGLLEKGSDNITMVVVKRLS